MPSPDVIDSTEEGPVRLVSLTRVAPLLFLLAVACSSAGAPASAPAGGAGATAGSGGDAQRSRTLVMAIRVEPNSLLSNLGLAGGATLNSTQRLFNAHLVMFDQKGDPQPYL